MVSDAPKTLEEAYERLQHLQRDNPHVVLLNEKDIEDYQTLLEFFKPLRNSGQSDGEIIHGFIIEGREKPFLSKNSSWNAYLNTIATNAGMETYVYKSEEELTKDSTHARKVNASRTNPTDRSPS